MGKGRGSRKGPEKQRKDGRHHISMSTLKAACREPGSETLRALAELGGKASFLDSPLHTLDSCKWPKALLWGRLSYLATTSHFINLENSANQPPAVARDQKCLQGKDGGLWSSIQNPVARAHSCFWEGHIDPGTCSRNVPLPGTLNYVLILPPKSPGAFLSVWFIWLCMPLGLVIYGLVICSTLRMIQSRILY